jgi:shikimate dehydrogenase
MKKYGLIGKKLTHSFSAGYFEKKFERENLPEYSYELFEIPEIHDIEKIFRQEVSGFNVTIPYKTAIIPYLDELDESARKVGAVNVVKIDGRRKIGYNSDYTGFRESLETWLREIPDQALVLGTGGASRAVVAVLNDLDIRPVLVSRSAGEGRITYQDLDEVFIRNTSLIVNSTPLGTFPDIDQAPDIPYDLLTTDHYLYDLVYNPEVTLFMQYGLNHGATVKNGLEMLHIQAERSWEIWNDK